MNKSMTTTVYLSGEHLQNGMLENTEQLYVSPHYTVPNIHKLWITYYTCSRFHLFHLDHDCEN